MPDEWTIDIRPCASLDETDRLAVEMIDRAAFQGHNDLDALVWSGPEWQVMGRLKGEIVAIAGILERLVRVGQRSLRVGGVGGVATPPSLQKRGLGSAVMRAADEFMLRTLRVEFGLLACDPDKVGFYARLGWQVLPAQVIFDQPDGPRSIPGVNMALPCVRAEWPAGTIDLCGLPW